MANRCTARERAESDERFLCAMSHDASEDAPCSMIQPPLNGSWSTLRLWSNNEGSNDESPSSSKVHPADFYHSVCRTTSWIVVQCFFLECRPVATSWSWSVSMGDQCMKLYPHISGAKALLVLFSPSSSRNK